MNALLELCPNCGSICKLVNHGQTAESATLEPMTKEVASNFVRWIKSEGYLDINRAPDGALRFFRDIHEDLSPEDLFDRFTMRASDER